MNALQLIQIALRLIGVIASGESLSANEANDGLSALNDMLDSWSNENLLIPNKTREVFPLVASQQAYTWGTGGNFNSSRPQRIENAAIQLTTSTPPMEIPVKILTKDQYAAIILKGISSTFPLYIYSDNAFPMTSVNVWPVPSAVNNLVFYSWKPLLNIATLTTAISMPPGYNEALKYNLAIRLSAEYGRQPPEVVIGFAAKSISDIKRMNTIPKYLRVDDDLLAKPAVWDWMTGEPT